MDIFLFLWGHCGRGLLGQNHVGKCHYFMIEPDVVWCEDSKNRSAVFRGPRGREIILFLWVILACEGYTCPC
jgi:hypothetical protein